MVDTQHNSDLQNGLKSQTVWHPLVIAPQKALTVSECSAGCDVKYCKSELSRPFNKGERSGSSLSPCLFIDLQQQSKSIYTPRASLPFHIVSLYTRKRYWDFV